jgi:predicted ATPase/DNA-binding CsgD family transcriptional regulator
MSPLIGRSGELAAIGACLDANRLVTLTGAGGVGKTRLAVEAAAERTNREAIRCWWVDLATLRNPDAVASAVASALAVRETVNEAAVDAIGRLVGGRPVLLVLDNCEHLVAPCADLTGRLLALCAGLTVLATSREPLGVPGEVSWPVPSLPAPESGQRMTAGRLEGYEAVQLFADRAARVRPGFALDEGNGVYVGEICARLDGIPLAIELAAARCRAMAPEQIAGELDHRFRLLTGGARTALARQQTLAASVSWSYDLLDEHEQDLFRRLGVFTGPFPIDSVEAVCGGAVDRWAVLDVLSQLVGKSLVVFDPRTGWYSLLETLRLYALERCGERGEVAAARDVHAAWWAGWLQRQHPQAPSDADLDAIELAYPNLRAALEWSVLTDPALSLELTGVLGIYWNYANRLGEAAVLGGAALEAGRQADPAAWARAAGALSYPRYWAGDTEFLSTVTAEAAKTAAEAGDLLTASRCQAIPMLEFTTVDQLRQTLAMVQAAGDPWFEARTLGPLAITEIYSGDPQAQAHLDRLGALAEQIGCSAYRAGHRLIAAIQLSSAGQFRAALEHLDGTFPSLDRPFNPQVCLMLLANMAWYALLLDDQPRLGQAVRRLADTPLDWGRLRPIADALPGVMGLAPRTAGPVHLPGLFANVIWAFLDGEPEPASRGRTAAGAQLQPKHPMEQVDPAIRAYLDGDLREAEQQIVALRLHPAEARPFFLVMLAHCAAEAGSHTEAARLLGAADALRERCGLQWFPRFLAAGRAKAEDTARVALGDEPFAAAYAEGSSLDAGQAAAYTLRAHGRRGRPATGWSSLTPTELQVAQHVAAGQSNPQIASALFISRATVKTHLAHIFAKLGMTSRAELAAEATRHLPGSRGG